MPGTLLLGVGWRAAQYPITYDGIPIRNSVAVHAAWRAPEALEFALTTRLVTPATAEPSWAFEVAPSASLTAAIGHWHPASGLELGWSTRHSSEVLEQQRPPGSYFADMGTPWPLWLDFQAAPARFALNDKLEVDVAKVGLGISLPHLGLSGRWAVDVVTLSYAL